MSRIAKKTAVTQNMYKQFAIVTVVITALIAMFANGENSQAVADAIKEKQQQEALRALEAKKLHESRELAAKPRNADYNAGGGGSDGVDGAQTNSFGGGSSTPPPSPYGYGPQRPAPNPLMPMAGGNRPRTVSERAPNGKTWQELERDKAAAGDKMMGDNGAPSQEQLDKIRAASAARSSSDDSE